MHKLYNGGRKKLYEWLEKVCNNLCEDQAIEDQTSLEEVERKFYIDPQEGLVCPIPTLLYKFLIENGSVQKVEPRSPLGTPTSTNWKKKRPGVICQQTKVGVFSK